MAEEAGRKKRKRSAVACVACHDRKVRCNAAWQGIPCSNCVEDAISCHIYRRSTEIPTRKLENTIEALSPPSSATQSASGPQTTPIIGAGHVLSPNHTPTQQDAEEFEDRWPQRQSKVLPATAQGYARSETPRQKSVEPPKRDLRPYFAGESEGIEFLFDLCRPERPIRGLHYSIAAERYHVSRSVRTQLRQAPSLPPYPVQQELIRLFFEHVWPLLPVVDARDFLTAYGSDANAVSPLLLRSIFFAAASFVDHNTLRALGARSRKTLKMDMYQIAKDLFDGQQENDKIVLIQSALLLSSAWYIDLEDRDGLTHWIGVAISLSFTMGLHRKDDYDSLVPCPYPKAVRRVWKCLWWSIMCREAWVALGSGRPMRVDSEDCDLPIPAVQDVFGDLDGIPPELRCYLPPNPLELASVWINLLHLSMVVERILKRYYRPRSATPSPSQMRDEELAIWSSRERFESTNKTQSSHMLSLTCYMKLYYNIALIVLYRPCMAKHLEGPRTLDRGFLEEVARRAKNAAAEITGILNELLARNAINTAPNMIVMATMCAVQMYMWEVRHSTGLARQFAFHQLDLYMLVLNSLRETYWIADLQHNLFTQALKVLGDGPSATEKPSFDSSNHQELSNSADESRTGIADPTQPDGCMTPATFDDFLYSFNPFVGLPLPADDLR